MVYQWHYETECEKRDTCFLNELETSFDLMFICSLCWLTFLSPWGKGRLTSNLHFYDLHTSKLQNDVFLSSIYKWTLTLLRVESSSAVFAIYFIRSAGLLCPDSRWRQKPRIKKMLFPSIQLSLIRVWHYSPHCWKDWKNADHKTAMASKRDFDNVTCATCVHCKGFLETGVTFEVLTSFIPLLFSVVICVCLSGSKDFLLEGIQLIDWETHWNFGQGKVLV